MDADCYTEFGAGLLASQIESYWRSCGFRGIRAERFEVMPGFFGVRSNIGPDGYPPREREKVAI